jgi:hypothetical protein
MTEADIVEQTQRYAGTENHMATKNLAILEIE